MTLPELPRHLLVLEKCVRRIARRLSEQSQLRLYERFSRTFSALEDTTFSIENEHVKARQGGSEIVFPRPLPLVNAQHIVFGYRNWLQRKYQMPGFVEVESGDIVIDCGGYVGGFSLSAAMRASQVHIFEPSTSNAACIRLNHAEASNVTVVEAGLFSETKDMQLNLSHSGVEHSLLEPDKGDSGETQTIKVWALADYCADHKVPVPDFVKIEAEGVELEVWKGLRELRPKKLAIDASPERDGQSPADEFTSLLTEQNYEVRRRKYMLFAKRLA